MIVELFIEPNHLITVGTKIQHIINIVQYINFALLAEKYQQTWNNLTRLESQLQ